MQISRLALVLLLQISIGTAEEVHPEVLRKLVKDFLITNYQRSGFLNQMSFMIGLSPEQCRDASGVRYYMDGKNEPIPNIATSVKDFNTANTANYMAVLPDPHQKCSEFKMLRQPESGWDVAAGQQSREMTGAEWLGGKLQQTLQGGGCVVFYTTNSPCLKYCFNDTSDRRIDKPLSEDPFRSWKDRQNVALYFVYTQTYKNDEECMESVQQGFSNLANMDFHIWNCPYEVQKICPECKAMTSCNTCKDKTTWCNNCKERMRRCRDCQVAGYDKACQTCAEFEKDCPTCNRIPKEKQIKCKDCYARRQNCEECKTMRVYCETCVKTQTECFECEKTRDRACEDCRNRHLECDSCLSTRIKCQVKNYK
nr:PREDICTED: uncharacterized protein LOC107075984 [Lepisosteus oculatus]